MKIRRQHGRRGQGEARKPELSANAGRTGQLRTVRVRTDPLRHLDRFSTNQQGDVVSRRLSWFSPITDNAMFVNQRATRRRAVARRMRAMITTGRRESSRPSAAAGRRAWGPRP